MVPQQGTDPQMPLNCPWNRQTDPGMRQMASELCPSPAFSKSVSWYPRVPGRGDRAGGASRQLGAHSSLSVPCVGLLGPRPLAKPGSAGLGVTPDRCRPGSV